MLLEAVGLGQGQAPLERRLPGGPARLPLGGADVVEGMGEDLGLAQRLGQRDRAATPGDRLVDVVGQHAELGQVAVRHGQLGAGGEALQQLHGLPPGSLGVAVAALEPGQA